MPYGDRSRGANADGKGQGLWAVPGREDLLRQLWADGVSASSIARRIPGTTRSGILGKVFRLGLAKRNSGSNQCFANKQSSEKKGSTYGANFRKKSLPSDTWATHTDEATDIVVRISDPLPEDCLLIGQLTRRDQCRFPVHTNAKGEHLFCGRETCSRGSEAWCAEHAKRVYGSGPSYARRDAWTEERKTAHAAKMRVIYNTRQANIRRRAGVA